MSLPQRGKSIVTIIGSKIDDGKFLVAYRKIALPAGVAGIGFRQSAGNREVVAVGFEPTGKVALRHLHIADLLVPNRQIALPAGVAGIGFRQLLGYGEAVAV